MPLTAKVDRVDVVEALSLQPALDPEGALKGGVVVSFYDGAFEKVRH